MPREDSFSKDEDKSRVGARCKAKSCWPFDTAGSFGRSALSRRASARRCGLPRFIDEWAEHSAARMAKWPEQSEEERKQAAIEVIRKCPRRRQARRE